MGNGIDPVLIDMSSDEDGPEDQTPVIPLPLVRRAAAGPSKRQHPSTRKLENDSFRVSQYSPAHAGPSQRKHPQMKYQDKGLLVCRHCPFRTNVQSSLNNHESHHSANFEFKCSYCSFSSTHSSPISRHTNRVHEEEMASTKKTTKFNHPNAKKMRSSTDSRRSVNESYFEEEAEDVSEPSDSEDKSNLEFFHHDDGTGEDSTEDPPNFNDIPQNEIDEVEVVPYIRTIPKVELVDISMETDDEEDEVVHKDLDEVNCLCDEHQPEVGGQFMICCDQCDDWFHGSCVNISEERGKQLEQGGVDWFCPRCIHSEPPIRHQTKLIQAVDAVAKQLLPIWREEQVGYSLPAVSQPDLEGDSIQLGTWASVMGSESQQEEEAVCRAELAKLAKDIKEAQTALKKKEQSLDQEGSKMRESQGKKVDKLREMVEELEMKERALNIERRVYLDQKGDVNKQLIKLTTEKIQLDRELVKLKNSSVSRMRIKPEPSSSHSAATFNWNRVLILEKETHLGRVLGELEESLKWDNYLSGRILEVEKNLAGTVETLLEVRTDCSSMKDDPSAAGSSSPDVEQLKALKEQQRSRIATFVGLEKKVVQISCGHVIEGIRRIEEEWMKVLDEGEIDF